MLKHLSIHSHIYSIRRILTGYGVWLNFACSLFDINILINCGTEYLDIKNLAYWIKNAFGI